MTAPVPRADVSADLADPPPLAVAQRQPAVAEVTDEQGGAAAVAPTASVAPAVSRWAWFVVIAVLVLAVAGTGTVLLIQWTSPGSGTVAR